MKKYWILAALMFAGAAYATDDPCKHPNFVTHECLATQLDGSDGENGQDGQDGQDGRDGIDGQNGKDGRDGIDGLNGKDGRDGIDGLNGKDGRDGIDGLNGKDGRDGIDGLNGINGKDGVVPTEWINEVRNFNSTYSKYVAASDAVQIFLPQDDTSRVTFGVSRVNSETGIGLGYAYRCHGCDRKPALTIGIGSSGGETTGRASIGWEF